MIATFVLDVVGVRVRVQVRDQTADHDAALRSTLASLIVDEPADDFAGTVNVDSGDVEAVLAAAVRAAIDRSAHLLLHAGAVAADGRATLFPGASGQGKSTLTAACLRRGFGYVTDELVALDLETGTISGLARPLMLTAWSARAMGLDDDDGAGKPAGKRAVPPEQLDSATVGERLPVANVIVWRRGARTSALTPLPAGAILREILTASFNHYVHAERAWHAAAGLASTARGWRLDVGDPASAAELVAELAASQDAGTGAERPLG